MAISPTGRRAGLSKQFIIGKAVSLSEQMGIDGWTMRDISKELNVVPSVLYHYFPNKESLCSSVVEQVCADITLPDENLDWKAWFTAMAHAVRPVLLRYHGITDRFARGKFTEKFLPSLDIAYRKLMEAGFGDKTALAYMIISNSVIHTIGARNLRSSHQIGERHDLNTMIGRFKPMMEKSPGLRAMVDTYIKPLSTPEREDELSAEYYGLIVATVLEGVERVLLPQANPQSSNSQTA
ncbi:TetR/AcrR family transcriptional regulator [Arcanobacterium hippocoleae]